MVASFKAEDVFAVAGQRAIVTGGGSGLGKAMAAGLAANGAKVYIVGRRAETLEKAAKEIREQASKGGEVFTVWDLRSIQGDVSTKASCQEIIKQYESTESVLDSLIHCAGVGVQWRDPAKDHDDPDQVTKMMMTVEDDDFDNLHRINVNGPYFLTCGLLPCLRKAKDPNVIIIASLSGLRITRSMSHAAYQVTKAAAIHCSTMLAGRLHPLKIRVNSICPGVFPSEMTGSTSGAFEYALSPFAEQAARRCTIGRGGRPEEIIGPCLLLCSPAGGYITGINILVDGGRMLGAGIYDGMPVKADLGQEAAVF